MKRILIIAATILVSVGLFAKGNDYQRYSVKAGVYAPLVTTSGYEKYISGEVSFGYNCMKNLQVSANFLSFQPIGLSLRFDNVFYAATAGISFDLCTDDKIVAAPEFKLGVGFGNYSDGLSKVGVAASLGMNFLYQVSSYCQTGINFNVSKITNTNFSAANLGVIIAFTF